MIAFEKLEKRYGRKQVLQEISLELDAGQIHAILGPNGSGKTTLIKCLMGLVHPDGGHLRLEGEEIKGHHYRHQVAYIPQIARFPENLRPLEFLGLIEQLRGKAPRKAELVDYFDLQEHLRNKLGQLSGGTRQKVNLIAALMYDVPYLLLDEPSIGLDPVALLKLKDFLLREKNRGKTLLITTHVMSLVQELASQVVFLHEGAIYYQGSPEALRQETGTADVEHAIAALLRNPENARHV